MRMDLSLPKAMAESRQLILVTTNGWNAVDGEMKLYERDSVNDQWKAAGEKIPRKGGPGITRSDLLVINKIDLAPFVGANLEVMEADALLMRPTRPFIFTNLKSGEGVQHIAQFIVANGGLEPRE